MVCPHCGDVNPDGMNYCGSCGRLLDEPAEADSVDRPGEVASLPQSQARDRALSIPRSQLTMAAIAAGVAVVLIMASFVLHVYYYERILGPHDFGDHQELMDIGLYATYARLFGEVAALIGAVIIVQSLLVAGSGSALATLKKVNLKSLLWLGTAMATFIAVSASVLVYVSEARPDLDETAGELLARAMTYPLLLAVLFGSAALFIVAIGLRNARDDTSTAQGTRRPEA